MLLTLILSAAVGLYCGVNSRISISLKVLRHSEGSLCAPWVQGAPWTDSGRIAPHPQLKGKNDLEGISNILIRRYEHAVLCLRTLGRLLLEDPRVWEAPEDLPYWTLRPHQLCPEGAESLPSQLFPDKPAPVQQARASLRPKYPACLELPACSPLLSRRLEAASGAVPRGCQGSTLQPRSAGATSAQPSQGRHPCRQAPQ